MPIKAPEPWLGKTVKLKGLKLGLGAKAGSKRLDFSLNITPMIDMFVILVVFLLMVFSATGEILFQQKDIKLPDAYTSKPLDRVPIIGISQSVILFEGEMVMSTTGVDEKNYPDLKLPELFKRLKAAREAYAKEHPMPQDKGDMARWIEQSKQIIIQADKGVSFVVIRLVMTTAAQEGYSAINFAVVPKGHAGTVAAQ